MDNLLGSAVLGLLVLAGYGLLRLIAWVAGF
jgi:hypothetical protein